MGVSPMTRARRTCYDVYGRLACGGSMGVPPIKCKGEGNKTYEELCEASGKASFSDRLLCANDTMPA